MKLIKNLTKRQQKIKVDLRKMKIKSPKIGAVVKLAKTLEISIDDLV